MNTLSFIWLIASREIRERFRSKAFRISTAVVLVLIVGAILILPMLGDDGPSRYEIGLVGTEQETLADQLVQTARETGVELTTKVFPDQESGKQAVDEGEIDAVLTDGPLLTVKRNNDEQLPLIVNVAIYQEKLFGIFADLDPVQQEKLALLATESTASLEEIEQDAESVLVIASSSSVILFLVIQMYGGAVLYGVVEEKTTRAAEVLLATLKPWYLLGGKILGIGLLGLGQLIFFLAVGLGTSLISNQVELPDVFWTTLPWIIPWFLLGFLFYAASFATAGSLTSRPEDAQNTAVPVSFALMGAYLFSIFVVGPNPDSMWSRTLSLLPPIAPMTVPSRIAHGEITPLEIAIAFVFMLVGIYAMTRLAGRVYATMLLRTGRPVKLREALATEKTTLAKQ